MGINKTSSLPPGSAAERKLAVLLLGLLCAVLAGEAALRLGGFLFKYAQERRNTIALGSGGYRIMCLGESMTVGSDTNWPDKLEKSLSARQSRGGVFKGDRFRDDCRSAQGGPFRTYLALYEGKELPEG